MGNAPDGAAVVAKNQPEIVACNATRKHTEQKRVVLGISRNPRHRQRVK
jgi:hypothetical protein